MVYQLVQQQHLKVNIPNIFKIWQENPAMFSAEGHETFHAALARARGNTAKFRLVRNAFGSIKPAITRNIMLHKAWKCIHRFHAYVFSVTRLPPRAG